ncbi:MAG: GIY-YIG nuclease family protein [Bacteroidota bacterium]
MTNNYHTVLYTGVTNNFARRIYEHKESLLEGFTKRYNLNKLVYYEAGGSAIGAIDWEKQIKKMSRERKKKLISEMNPHWNDLYDQLV